MDVRQRVTDILAEQAMVDPSDVKSDHTLFDLGIDSMGLVECIFAIEETFDVTVPFNANNPDASDFDISCVESVIRAVEELVKVRT